MTLNADTLVAALGMVSIREEIPVEQFTIGSSSALVVLGLRESCDTLSVWLEKEAFTQLCVTHKVTNHPMTDTLVTLELGRCAASASIRVDVRERNPYFESYVLEGFSEEVNIFKDLTLLIQKRQEYAKLRETSASVEEVQQVQQDIRVLNDRHAEKNKVKEVA